MENGLDKRLRELAEEVARHGAYWEAQQTLNAEVKAGIDRVEVAQGAIRTDISTTKDSVKSVTGTLRWILGVVTAIAIAVVVKEIRG